jgi:hypothetical protein
MLIRTMSPVRPKECPSLAIIHQAGFLSTPQATSLTSLSQSSTARRLGIDRKDEESTSANPCDWFCGPSLSRTGPEVQGAIESPCIDRSRVALFAL